VIASILENEAGAAGEGACRLRQPNLPRGGRCGDACNFVYGDAPGPLCTYLDLAHVHTDPDREALTASKVLKPGGAFESTCGSFEERKHPVPRRIDLAAAKETQLAAKRLVVRGQQPTPGGITESVRLPRLIDDIAHQQTRKHAVAKPHPKPGPRLQP
jgi:hypothetical protein